CSSAKSRLSPPRTILLSSQRETVNCRVLSKPEADDHNRSTRQRAGRVDERRLQRWPRSSTDRLSSFVLPFRENTIMTAALAGAWSAIVLAVIPTVSHDGERVEGERLGQKSTVRNVRVDPEVLEMARRQLAERARIAVFPIVTSKGDPGRTLAALGCTLAL